MKMIPAILGVYTIEWVANPFVADQWSFLLCSKYLLVFLLATQIFNRLDWRNPVLGSMVGLFVLSSFSDFVKIVAWNYWSQRVDTSPWMACLFITWLLYVIERRYPKNSAAFNPLHVHVLLLRPTSPIDVIKGLFGAPFSSVCIYAGGAIWAFRRASGVFEKTEYSPRWLERHVWIDAQQKASQELLSNLEALIGAKRGAGCKCVWEIRNVLRLLGGKFVVKNWLEFVPGFYALKLLTKGA